ncbi:MAG: hypothetical protein BGO05_16585 [Rhizobiales bacterium 63-7]|nr:MAG: hypothetical protein BGO05_16585 [Rhizobiales bacterium 63-7]
MARPTKSPADKRTERLPYARLTVAERVTVEAMANAAGLSVSEFARRAVLGQRIAPPKARGGVPVGLLSDLARIGNNLNQIARRANASGNVPAHLPEVLDLLRDRLDRLAGEVDE